MESNLNINCTFIVSYKLTLYLQHLILRNMLSDLLVSVGVDDVYVRGDLYAGKYKPDKAAYER
jgi:hypothetical protein